LIKFFKQRNPLLYLLLFVFTFALNSVLFFLPSVDLSFEHSLLTSLFDWNLPDISYSLQVTILILLVFFQALLVNQIFQKFQLTKESSLLPSFLFITLQALFPKYILAGASFFSLFLLLLMLNHLLTLFDRKEAIQRIFFIAFFVGIGGLIYSPMYLFVLLIIVSIPSLKTPLSSEFAIIPFGLLTPIYLIGMYYYMIGDLSNFIGSFSNSFPIFTFSFQNRIFPNAIPVGFLLLVLSIGFFKDTFVVENKVVRLTKYHRIFVYFFLLSLLLFLFTSASKENISYYFIVPVTFFLSSMFTSENSRLYEVMYAILMLIVVLLQANMLLHFV
jgi:hypothetical protein